MEYFKVAETSDLQEDNTILGVINGREILIVKFEDSYYAIDNKCPHMGANLYKHGIVDGNIVTCRRHRTKIDVMTGKIISKPKVMFITLDVKDAITYPLKVEGDDILIGLE